MKLSKPSSRNRHWLAFLVATLLIASLSAPWQLATAQDGDDLTGTSQDTGEEAPQESAPTEPPAIPTEAPPTVEPTLPPEPTTAPPPTTIAEPEATNPPAEPEMRAANDDPPGSLDVHYRICPLGTDLLTAELETICSELGEANFELTGTDPGSTYMSGQRSTGGIAEFAFVPPGAYRISLPGLPGWPMAAWCDVLESLDPDRGNTRPYTQRNLPNASLDIEVGPAETISCRWFAIDPMESGDIALTAFVCPSGLETIRYDHRDLVTGCAEPFDPIGLGVVGGQQGVDEWVYTNPPSSPEWPNGALLPDLPTGPYNVYVDLPEDLVLASVYCRAVGIDSDNPQVPFETTSFDIREQPRVDVQLAAHTRLECHLFIEHNLSIELELVKYSCPDGMDIGNASHSSLRESCSYLMDPVEFLITSGPLEESIYTDEGMAGLYPVPSGDVTIREITPKSTRLAAVYCAIVPLKDHDNDAYEPVWESLTPDPSSSVRVTTEPRDILACEFFNIATDDEEQEPGYASVTLTKYACGQEIDWNMASHTDLREACTADPGEVVYTVTAGDHHDQATIDRDAMVYFQDIPTHYGPVSVTEYLSPGSALAAVYCTTGTDYASTPYTGSTIAYPLEDGDRLSCDFFNEFGQQVVDDYSGEVTLYKWTCPADTGSSQAPVDYADTCTTPGDGFEFELEDANGSRTGETLSGMVRWENVVANEMGNISIRESIPAGYGTPVVSCEVNIDPRATAMASPAATDGGILLSPPMVQDWEYTCHWYNIPIEPGSVTLYKWDCPEGIEIEHTHAAYQASCVTPLDGVTFSLESSAGSTPVTTSGGVASWTGVPLGVVTLTEDLPLGYSPQPYVSCATIGENTPPLTYSVVNHTVTMSLDTSGQEVRCDWYNQYLGAGEITVYKWLCPAGYDYTAWQADPRNDCGTPMGNVSFSIDGPSGTYESSTSQNGTVTFGTLQPGTWEVRESVPSGITGSFVWNCVGLRTSAVHPAPLATGSSLTVTVAAGDRIACNWMNVPPYEPAYGWLSLSKYHCATVTYQSDIDCYRGGAGHTFDLQTSQGQSWVTVATATTNNAGQVTFSSLQPGDYRLVERGSTPCLIKSSVITPGGYVGVNAGAGTTVNVYNCGTPVPKGKTPTKFPNTGVAPESTEPPATTPPGGTATLPAIGAMLGIARSRRNVLRVAFGGAVVTSGAALMSNRAFSAQDIVPLDIPATPEASPSVDPGCLHPATPESVIPGTPVACARGAVPVQIAIPSIEVDAPIEYLDFIDGEMEQPTGEINVAWYKQTARLGETGNILLAGHLNWWGVPEAVFFRLATLQPGDLVEVTGDDGEIYRYIVDWMEPFPAADPPPDDALGPTDNESLTLITCGGEWDVSAAEYNQRSVVRATRETPLSAS